MAGTYNLICFDNLHPSLSPLLAKSVHNENRPIIICPDHFHCCHNVILIVLHHLPLLVVFLSCCEKRRRAAAYRMTFIEFYYMLFSTGKRVSVLIPIFRRAFHKTNHNVQCLRFDSKLIIQRRKTRQRRVAE